MLSHIGFDRPENEISSQNSVRLTIITTITTRTVRLNGDLVSIEAVRAQSIRSDYRSSLKPLEKLISIRV